MEIIMANTYVAVVGRPNVGKSTLFNKIVGGRPAIVEDTPGVTRDRLYHDAEWNGVPFTLVDTGGIEPHSDDVILSQMRTQAMIAIETADVVILVTDITTGVTAADSEVADMLLKAKKDVILCVNKVDRPGNPPPELYEFYNLGLGDPYPVSAVHGLGTGDLLDEVVSRLKDHPCEEKDENSSKRRRSRQLRSQRTKAPAFLLKKKKEAKKSKGAFCCCLNGGKT